MSPLMAARRAMVLTTIFDAVMAALAIAFAALTIWITQEHIGSAPLRSIGLSMPLFMAAAICGFLLRGVQKQVWRHMGAPDVMAILQGIGLSALIYLPAMIILTDQLVRPWATLMVALVYWMVALFGGRMVARMRSTRTPLQIFSAVDRAAQPAILIGDEKSCVEVLRRQSNQSGPATVRVLGIIETSGQGMGRALRGITIMGGLDDLANTLDLMKLRYGQTPWLAMTGDARNRKGVETILEVAAQHGAEVMALGPDETSLVLEPIRPADLLARPERQLDLKPVSQIVYDASVLVTGGGGTIGSELTRQVADMDPSKLTVIDSSEFNLYSIEMELRQKFPDIALLAKLGDVRDERRITHVFQAAQPSVVIHAAALKHVPLMEQNFCEAILTNVGGAMIAVRAALAVGAKHFVFISTDKAVDPDNVMGATKRLAEIAISRIAQETGLSVSMVRFGNVLGSSGSVVPLFERQIAAGGPVTVTHDDVTRYFMTVEEASSLVLQASALQAKSDHSGLFVLDMGEPILIRQLAETMIRLKGKVPGRDIQIETTGLRPGEKMHEALTYEHEEVSETSVSGVMRVASHSVRSSLFDKQLAALIEAASQRQRDEALRLLSVLVPEYGEQDDASKRRILA